MLAADRDMVVELRWAQESADRMRQVGMTNLDFRIYSGLEHSANEEELMDVVDWLERVLPHTTP